jgi:hypothetical protein
MLCAPYSAVPSVVKNMSLGLHFRDIGLHEMHNRQMPQILQERRNRCESICD